MPPRTRLIATFSCCFVVAANFSNAAWVHAQIDYERQIKSVLAQRCGACHGALRQEGNLRLDTAALAIRGGDSGPAIQPGDAAQSLLIQKVASLDDAERMPPEGEPLQPDQISALRMWIDQNAEAPTDEQPDQDPREHWAFRSIEKPLAPQVANAAWVRNPIDAFVAQRHEQLGLTPQVEASRETLVRRLCLDLVGLPPTEAELAELDADHADAWYERLVQRLLDDPRHGERWARHWMDIWRYSDWWGLGDQLRNSQRHMWRWRDWIVESLNANTPYDEMLRLMLAADELHPADPEKLRATGYLARNYFLFNRNQWMEETVEHVSKAMLGITINCAKCHDHKYDPFPQVDFYRLRAFFEPYHVRLDMVSGEPDLARDGIARVFDGLLDAPTYRLERGQESQPDQSQIIAPGVPDLLALEQLPVRPVALPKRAWQPARQPWVLETYAKAAQQKVTDSAQAVAALREKLAAAKRQLADLDEADAIDQPSRESAAAAVADATTELRAAENASCAAQAEWRSVDARAAAMRAAWAAEDNPADGAQLARAAAAAGAKAIEAERLADVAKARHAVAVAEWKGRTASADQNAAWQQELDAARKSLAAAQENAAASVTSPDAYTRLAGAKWTPTRFVSSTADDPQVEFPAHSTGRRTALAAWITDPRNPLTARVAANHIWTRHMGTPLVATLFDFGRHGSPPTHPGLLDWLAAELIDSGWDMKHLHRLIVQSSAYRMSSSAAGCDANAIKDPDNQGWWRRTPIRLESQVVRDSILSLAGTLDLSRGGPPVPQADQAESMRRSLYFFHSNNDRNRFLAAFDEAPVNECYRRDQSIVPQQALALSNSRLVHDAARQIEKRLSKYLAVSQSQSDDKEFIERAFYVILGMRVNHDEIRASTEALKAWRELPAAIANDSTDVSVGVSIDVSVDDSLDLARAHLVWALLNHGDFVTVR